MSKKPNVVLEIHSEEEEQEEEEEEEQNKPRCTVAIKKSGLHPSAYRTIIQKEMSEEESEGFLENKCFTPPNSALETFEQKQWRLVKECKWDEVDQQWMQSRMTHQLNNQEEDEINDDAQDLMDVENIQSQELSVEDEVLQEVILEDEMETNGCWEVDYEDVIFLKVNGEPISDKVVAHNNTNC